MWFRPKKQKFPDFKWFLVSYQLTSLHPSWVALRGDGWVELWRSWCQECYSILPSWWSTSRRGREEGDRKHHSPMVVMSENDTLKGNMFCLNRMWVSWLTNFVDIFLGQFLWNCFGSKMGHKMNQNEITLNSSIQYSFCFLIAVFISLGRMNFF